MTIYNYPCSVCNTKFEWAIPEPRLGNTCPPCKDKMMSDIPESIQVGTECGDLNREIKKCMEQYLEGDVEMMSKILRLVRRREKILSSAYNKMR